MPQAAVYCDRCERLIAPGELADAIVAGEATFCAGCVAALTPEELAALSGPEAAPGPSPGRQPGRRPKARAGRRRRARGVTPQDAPRAPRPPRAPPSRANLPIIALIVAAVLVGVCGLLLLGGGSRRRPAAVARPAVAPGPARPVREPIETPAPQPAAESPRAGAREDVATIRDARGDGGAAQAGLPDTVPVGDPGNSADGTSYGAVAYPYRIGRYEVTNAEYCEFLNAVARTDRHGLYNPGMAGEYGGITRSGAAGDYSYAVKYGMGNKPVNFVSWYDALRYANWLTNGRGNGGTETGSYAFAGEGGGAWVRTPDHAALAAGKAVKWALASENEWYKAAYYDPGRPGGAGYWPFAAKGGGAPAGNVGGGAPSDAGAYRDSASAYGTFDQNGNMWEWNETRAGGNCGVRGGSFYINDRQDYLRSSTRYVSNPPTFEFCNYGFRVVALGGVPGPGATSAEVASTAKAADTVKTVDTPKVADTAKAADTIEMADSPKAADTARPAKAVDTVGRTKATTFYVSRSSGNDGWTGDAASPKGTRGPWKTLARASTGYVPGDRILLKCGDTWDEELRPKGSGTPSKPIVISSYGEGAKPVIDRQDYNQDRVGIFLHDQEGFKIVGIEFSRCMTGIYAEYSDNCPTKRYIWIEGCYFRDSLKYGDYKTYPTPRNIGLGICFFSYERDKRIVLEDIMIRNCVFRRLASAVWTNSPDNFNKNASFVYNFGNMNFEDCLFEEGYQWQQGIRGVDKGSMRNCVTVDIGRGFRAWNGVAGSMFFRARDWVFEDCEWGFVDIGLGSGDGEAFDFEGNCNDMTMRDCLFHDTDGPGFLLCCYASDGHPNMGIRMENCVLNGKSKRPIGLPRCEIINTTDWNEVTWKKCRFYLSPGEVLMKVMDPEKEKRSSFVDCVVKNLSDACGTPNLAAGAKASASSQTPGSGAAGAVDGKADTSWRAASPSDQWLQLDFARPTTVNEFRIREDPSSSIIRYVIQCWDYKASRWVGCFNGRTIGPDFIAPIVSRATRKVRLHVMRTKGGDPCIREFEVYNDTSGTPHDVASSRRGQ